MPADDEENSMSVTQLASKYGFLKPLDSLLDDHTCKVSLRRHENTALCLALKAGNDEVTTRVFWAFVYTAEEAIDDMGRNRRNNDGDDSDSSMSDVAVTDDPIVAAREIIGKALLVAVECEGVPSFFGNLTLSEWDSKLQDSQGRTLLMLSAMNGSVELAKHVCIKGDGRTDKAERTAMHHACYHGHLAIVEFLAQESMSLTAKDNQGATPITAAAMGGHQNIVEFLLPRLSDEDRKAEFILAAKNGLERYLELILKFATDIDPKAREEYVNAKGKSANTPLHYAAENNHARVVRFLLLRRANLEAANKAAVTPLANAASSSSLESMKLLLDAGASTETLTRRKRSVLTDAIYYEREDAVQLLLEYGASTRLSDYWSYYDSLLEFTVAESSTSVLKVLLKHFDKSRRLASAGPLKEGIPTPTEAVRIVIKTGRVRYFDILLQVWKDFDPVIYERGLAIGSLFTYAARYGTARILESIWEHSKGELDVNKIEGYYGTALQAALVSSRDDLAKVEILLHWGARAAPDSSEWTTASHSKATGALPFTPPPFQETRN